MSTVTKRQPIKETVGAQYVCFNTMNEDGSWTEKFADEVEKTETVKKVSVKENATATDVYASGKVYDQEAQTSTATIEVEVIAFPDETVAKMQHRYSRFDFIRRKQNQTIFCIWQSGTAEKQ